LRRSAFVGTMTPLDHKEDAGPTAVEWAPATRFYRQLIITAMSLVVLAALVYLLDRFATVLQALLTAGFLAYIILPVKRGLVRYGIPPALAYLLIVAAILCSGAALRLAIQISLEDLSAKPPGHPQNPTRLVDQVARLFPGAEDEVKLLLHRESPTVEQGVAALRGAVETLAGFLGQAVVVLVYLIFMLAEQAGAGRRIARAFSPERAAYV